jgi:hypothetical protein
MVQEKSSLHTSQLPRSGHGILRSFVAIERGNSRRKGSLNDTSVLPVVLIFVFAVIIHFCHRERSDWMFRWFGCFVGSMAKEFCELFLILVLS